MFKNIFLRNEKELSGPQQEFVANYYDDEVSPNHPLMIENIPEFSQFARQVLYRRW